MTKHYLKTEYDEEGKATRYCAVCGEYLTHPDHIEWRETSPTLDLLNTAFPKKVKNETTPD